jgi:hypothetical protein
MGRIAGVNGVGNRLANGGRAHQPLPEPGFRGLPLRLSVWVVALPDPKTSRFISLMGRLLNRNLAYCSGPIIRLF